MQVWQASELADPSWAHIVAYSSVKVNKKKIKNVILHFLRQIQPQNIKFGQTFWILIFHRLSVNP